MVNEDRYFDELQKIIGETGCADVINERWPEVIDRLNKLSIEYCNEIQVEEAAQRIKYEKSAGSGMYYDLEKLPPVRLLAMNLILSYWIGWHSIPKQLYLVSDWTRIEDAYNKGKNAFIEQTDLGD